MKPVVCLGLVALTAAATAGWPAGAQEQKLTIASAGGAWQQAQRNAWYTPFAQKMGIKFNEEETSAGMARVQAMVQAHNVTDDVVTVDTAQVLAACDSSILVKLDWNKIAPRDSFLPGAARDCGMGLDVYGDVLAYNTDVVKSDPPTSVLALFDTKRWPGKRATASSGDSCSPATCCSWLSTGMTSWRRSCCRRCAAPACAASRPCPRVWISPLAGWHARCST